MNKIIKYGIPVMVGMNVACFVMNMILGHYTLGLNELDMVEIYIASEREFDLEISEEDCESCKI